MCKGAQRGSGKAAELRVWNSGARCLRIIPRHRTLTTQLGHHRTITSGPSLDSNYRPKKHPKHTFLFLLKGGPEAACSACEKGGRWRLALWLLTEAKEAAQVEGLGGGVWG